MKSDLTITSEHIQREDKDPVLIIHLHGWLDAQNEGRFRNEIQEAHSAGAHFLVIDLTEINMLTSAGIRAIMKAHNLFKPAEADQPSQMRLCNAPQQVYNALSITGFLQSIPIYENLQAALQSFEG